MEMMIYFLYFIVPILFFIGIGTTYDDWKNGRISNNWIGIGISYAFALIIVFSFLLGINGILNYYYLVEVILNTSIGFLFSFILWLSGMWSAGDAKLFIAYTFMIPINVYSANFIPVFPSAMLFFYTFIPLSAFLLFKNLSKIRFNSISIRKAIKPQNLISVFIFLAGFLWFLEKASLLLGIQLNVFFILMTLFIIFFILNKISKSLLLFVPLILLGLRLILDIYSLFTMEFLIRFLIIFIIFILFRFIILDSMYNLFSNIIRIKDLKKGMIPAEFFIKRNNKIDKEKINYYDSIFGALKKSDIVFYSTMLTTDDINQLKKVGGYGFQYLKIHQTLPFAPFMFSGVLIALSLYIISFFI